MLHVENTMVKSTYSSNIDIELSHTLFEQFQAESKKMESHLGEIRDLKHQLVVQTKMVFNSSVVEFKH